MPNVDRDSPIVTNYYCPRCGKSTHGDHKCEWELVDDQIWIDGKWAADFISEEMARLCYAAPDLLVMCKLIYEHLDGLVNNLHSDDFATKVIRLSMIKRGLGRTIAKAEGTND